MKTISKQSRRSEVPIISHQTHSYQLSLKDCIIIHALNLWFLAFNG